VARAQRSRYHPEKKMRFSALLRVLCGFYSTAEDAEERRGEIIAVCAIPRESRTKNRKTDKTRNRANREMGGPGKTTTRQQREKAMRRVLSFVSLILLILLSSGCYYNPMPLLGRAVYYPKYPVTQDTDSILTVHVNKKMDLQFRKIPDRDCWIGTTEVSIEQMKASWRWWRPDLSYYKLQPGYLESWPAMNVTLDEVAYYCSWLNRRMKHGVIPEGYLVRLPTVEEWEDAAKCGTDRMYPWGNEWPPVKFSDGQYSNVTGEDRFPKSGPSYRFRYGNMFYGYPNGEENKILGYRDGFPGPCPVEQAGMNEWGIMGLAGNVEEWCWDEKKQDHVLKGGDWMSFHPDSFRISASYELHVKPWPFCPLLRDRRSHYGSGFRVVLAPETKQD
jgi:hypothetical protein